MDKFFIHSFIVVDLILFLFHDVRSVMKKHCIDARNNSMCHFVMILCYHSVYKPLQTIQHFYVILTSNFFIKHLQCHNHNFVLYNTMSSFLSHGLLLLFCTVHYKYEVNVILNVKL